MYIRQKDGFYAGQVREFPSHIAQELIASGRATNPFYEVEDPPEFAVGGVVKNAPDVRVGEIVSDHFVPKKLAEKIARSANQSNRRRGQR